MRYLITGGAGFIGSHVARALVGRGDSVVVVDDLSTGRIENVQELLDAHPQERVRFRRGSSADPELMRDAARGVDAIAHLAASVGVGLVVRRPLESFLNNVRTTEVVLDAASETGAKVLITSSSEVYGGDDRSPLSEDALPDPGGTRGNRWAYGLSKEIGEALADLFRRERGVPTTVARLFNCAGPKQRWEFGMVIPRFVRQALRGEQLTVWGDGTQTRCFCHVEDTTEALMRLLDSEAAVGETVNVGSQEEITVAELAERVRKMTGSSSGLVFVPHDEVYGPDFEEMHHRVPDLTRIESLTRWQAASSLNDILTDVIEYERSLLTRAGD